MLEGTTYRQNDMDKERTREEETQRRGSWIKVINLMGLNTGDDLHACV